MSTDGLSDRDRAVLDAVSDDITAPSETDDPDELREAVYEIAEELEETQNVQQTILERLGDLEQQVDGNVETIGQTRLEQYADLPEDVTKDTLEPSEYRAVRIYEAWQELSWQAGNGRWIVDSARQAPQKYNPSMLRVLLERELDEDLDWNEIHRALKAVAILSGGEKRVDDYGRHHIEGGDFEYHVRATVDGSDTKHVLEEVPQ